MSKYVGKRSSRLRDNRAPQSPRVGKGPGASLGSWAAPAARLGGHPRLLRQYRLWLLGSGRPFVVSGGLRWYQEAGRLSTVSAEFRLAGLPGRTLAKLACFRIRSGVGPVQPARQGGEAWSYSAHNGAGGPPRRRPVPPCSSSPLPRSLFLLFLPFSYYRCCTGEARPGLVSDRSVVYSS